MVTIPEILAVMEPNRAYQPHSLERLIEVQRRRIRPDDLRPCERVASVLRRLVDSNRLRYIPGQRSYALPIEPYRGPTRKKLARPKRALNKYEKRVLRPPSVLYRARRLGLA